MERPIAGQSPDQAIQDFGKVVPIGKDDPSLYGGKGLSASKAYEAHVAECSSLAVFRCLSHGLGRVFHNGDSGVSYQFPQFRDVGWITEQMGRNNGQHVVGPIARAIRGVRDLKWPLMGTISIRMRGGSC